WQIVPRRFVDRRRSSETRKRNQFAAPQPPAFHAAPRLGQPSLAISSRFLPRLTRHFRLRLFPWAGVTRWRARLHRAGRRRGGDTRILDRRGPWSSVGLPARRTRRRSVGRGGNAARRSPRANRDNGRERFPEERRPSARGGLAGRGGKFRGPRG